MNIHGESKDDKMASPLSQKRYSRTSSFGGGRHVSTWRINISFFESFVYSSILNKINVSKLIRKSKNPWLDWFSFRILNGIIVYIHLNVLFYVWSN